MVTKVVVSRNWHHPEVETKVDENGIELSVTIEDFVRALAVEIGADPESAVAAHLAVLEKIKHASTQAGF